MTKKNQKAKEPEKMEIESAEAESEITESAQAEALSESTPSDPNPEEDTSVESLLDDVRHSLIEDEESSKAQKESKWWRRIGRSEKTVEPEAPQETIEIDLPATSTAGDVLEFQHPKAESEEYAEQIDDLIDMLEEEGQEPTVEVSTG